MKNTIITFLVLGVSITAYSQNNCECSKTLKQLTIKVEKEYPGFSLKTKDSVAYESFKSHLVGLSNSTCETNCYDVLKKNTDYFKDGHLAIIRKNTENIEDSKIRTIDTIDIDVEKF